MAVTCKTNLKNGYVNSGYIRGKFRNFANREHVLTRERICEIAKLIFPDKYNQFFKIKSEKAQHPVVMIQLLTYIIAHTVKGARPVNMGKDQWMPFNLFTMNIGGPAVGKSEIMHSLCSSMLKREDKEYAKYKKEFEEYEDDMFIYKSCRKSKSGEISEKPVCPYMVSNYIGCSDMQTVFGRCKRNPRGVLWDFNLFGIDQFRMDVRTTKYKTVRHILNSGYHGKLLMDDYVNDWFNLSLSMNVSVGILKNIISQKDTKQELFQKITPVIFPSRSAGFNPCSLFQRNTEEEDRIYDYYYEIISKLLDLNINLNPETGKPVFKEVRFTNDAREYYSNWRDSFSKSCAKGSMMQILVDSIVEKVARLAGCFHYLYLADKCVTREMANIEQHIDSPVNIADIEDEIEYIELIDMQRAIAFANIMIDTQERFMSLMSNVDKLAEEYPANKEIAVALHYR